jgi:hypothetical protein
MSNQNHIWSFSSVGGVKRVNLESGKDLEALEYLDQKLWTALSCPVYGLEIDHKTLELIDEDKDGQIKVAEILAAIKWISSVINNTDDLLKQASFFPLSAINTQTDEGKILLSSAQTILRNLGKPDANGLSVEDTSDTVKIFANTAFNGDGIISEDSCDNLELKTLLHEIITLVGSTNDRNGKVGINSEQLLAFSDACQAYAAWQQKTNDDRHILPFGNETPEAYLSYLAIKPKIDDYYLRCRLAAFDADSTAILNALVSRIESITNKDLSKCLDEISTYPLAKIEAAKKLPLSNGINPAWEAQMNEFRHSVCMVLFDGKTELDEKDWQIIINKFNAYEQWMAEKEGSSVESLGILRIQSILSNDSIQQLLAIIEKDTALENEANNIILVDKLVRYYRDLFTLIKNFVTFYDLYSPDFPAVFQAGTLYIDQRSCDLCIKVSDMPKHNTMVALSGMFLIYCDCVSKSTNEKMTIVAALTNGDIDNLIVGRNALFYDRAGNDYDATVIKIVDNPISIRQAFWSPYRKISEFIRKQTNKFASDQDNKVQASASSSIEAMPSQAIATPVPDAAPPAPFDVGKFVGIFAAIGLALGAIGTALASVVTGFMQLIWWKMPIAVSGILLVISGPSMIMAFFKLRKRNLAPILDANGWAINARVIINIQFGNTLTHLANLPKGAKLNMNDPFGKKSRPMWQIVLLLSALVGGILYLLISYELIKIHF